MLNIILFGIPHHVYTKNEPRIRALRLGTNPPGFNYTLPREAKWNGNGAFIDNHYVPHVGNDTACVFISKTNYCITEKYRYIKVTSTGTTFPSRCWFADCYVKVNFPGFDDYLINILQITQSPLTDFNSTPFLPKQACHGQAPTMLAPGWFYRPLALYHIFLVAHFQVTIAITGTDTRTRDVSIATRTVTNTGGCGSFISHRF